MADLQLAWIRPTFESLKVMHVDNVCTILVSTSRNCFAVRLVDTHARHFYMPIFGIFHSAGLRAHGLNSPVLGSPHGLRHQGDIYPLTSNPPQ